LSKASSKKAYSKYSYNIELSHSYNIELSHFLTKHYIVTNHLDGHTIGSGFEK